MPVDLASHPQYGAEAAKHRVAREAATAAADDVALAKANEEWANTSARLTAELYEKQDQERGRAARLTQIRAENPDVPDEVFENITDLDQAEKIAKSFQAVSAGRPKAQGQTGGTWSPPPGGGVASDPEDVIDPNEQRDPETGIMPHIQRRMDKIAPEVMAKGALSRVQNEELQRLSLEPLTTRFQAKQR